jgi:hypothetical protein
MLWWSYLSTGRLEIIAYVSCNIRGLLQFWSKHSSWATLRCCWQNVITINNCVFSISSFFFSSGYFFPRRYCPRVLIFCTDSYIKKSIRIPIKQLFGYLYFAILEGQNLKCPGTPFPPSLYLREFGLLIGLGSSDFADTCSEIFLLILLGGVGGRGSMCRQMKRGPPSDWVDFYF